MIVYRILVLSDFSCHLDFAFIHMVLVIMEDNYD